MGLFGSLFSRPPRMTADEVVRFYQGLGFLGGGAPGQGPEHWLARYEEENGRPLNPEKPWDDVLLLSLDPDRVWTGDPECDVCKENRVYTETLQEWSRISRGAFDPKEIREDWAGDEGPIQVQFTLGGVRHVLKPEWDQDWLDLAILTGINALLAGTGKHLACASDVNFAIVFLLDAAAREKLAKVRRFPFIL